MVEAAVEPSRVIETVMYVVGAVMAVFNIMACIICKLLWGMFQEQKAKLEEFVKNAPKTFLTTEAFDRNTRLAEKENTGRDTKISQLFGRTEDAHVNYREVSVVQDLAGKRIDRIESKMYKD